MLGNGFIGLDSSRSPHNSRSFLSHFPCEETGGPKKLNHRPQDQAKGCLCLQGDCSTGGVREMPSVGDILQGSSVRGGGQRVGPGLGVCGRGLPEGATHCHEQEGVNHIQRGLFRGRLPGKPGHTKA